MSRKAVWIIVVSTVTGAAALLCLALYLNADSAMKQARETWRRADYVRALPLFDAVIKEQPDRAEVWILRGSTHLELKREREAVRDCTEAIRLNPSLTDAYHYRSIALFGLRQWEASARDRTVVFEREPENSEAVYTRAMIYQFWMKDTQGRNPNEAARLQALMKADLTRASQLDPKKYGNALQDHGQ